jgi:beta-glucosidase
VIDNPPVKRVVDPFRGLEDAQHIAEESIVLLKNNAGQLPLNAGEIKSIAVIGSHADVGVLSGGGSAQVDAPGGNAVDPQPGTAVWKGPPIYFPSSPMKYIRAKAPAANVEYNEGKDPASAASLAGRSQVAIVFCNQPMREDDDARTLALPENQDALVKAVAAANPHTIVVLETGGPVSMPWIDQVQAVLEAWYPGIGGGQTIANILFGDVNPSAKLPITFAKSEADLPHPQIAGMGLRRQPFDVNYTEGLKVGYKWFEAEKKESLFPFGHGLSYTSYAYSDLRTSGKQPDTNLPSSVSFSVKNTGNRTGTEVAQVYVVLPTTAGEPFKRLVGWQRVQLAAGESKTVTLPLNPIYLSIYNVQGNGWQLVPGEYQVFVGTSSAETPLKTTFQKEQ